MNRKENVREMLANYTFGILGIVVGFTWLNIFMEVIKRGASLIDYMLLSICVIVLGLCSYLLAKGFEDLTKFLMEVSKKHG